MLWLFAGPIGVYLLYFFCSGIQCYLLFSPYLCFNSFLYLDLYVLGDDALISKGSFMQANYLCVLSTSDLRTTSFLWIFYYFFLSCVCYAFLSVCFYVPCGHLLGKGLTSWLSFVVSICEFVTFPLVSWVRCGILLYRFLIFAPLLT